MICVAIVGTGDFAHGLAHLYSVNSSSSEYELIVTKPSIEPAESFHDTNVPLVDFDSALSKASIVILGIPVECLGEFVERHAELLEGKVLVDPSNSYTPNQDLRSMLALSSIQWVKAFNDVGAVDALLAEPYYKTKIPTAMCSRYQEALRFVKAFAEESLGMTVKIISYEQYGVISQRQMSVGDAWIQSTCIILVVFVLTEVYALLRYNVYKGYDWFHLPLQVTNKAICWTAITGMAFTQLPGVLARMYRTLAGDSLKTLPVWLTKMLKMRKELGIVALWFLVIHIIMSLLLFNQAYYGKFFLEQTEFSKMNSKGENSFLFGILGAGLYAIMGVASLPSVGERMTNVQWSLVYGPVAWIALLFGTLHVIIMGAKGWMTKDTWPGGLPPITLTSTIIPMVVLALKCAQMVVSRTSLRLSILSATVAGDEQDKDAKKMKSKKYFPSDHPNHKASSELGIFFTDDPTNSNGESENFEDDDELVI